VGYNFNYAFGRNESSSTVARVEFIATSDCNRGHNSRACYGPSGLDRTSMLTSSLMFTAPGGFRFNSIWSFRTAPPQNLYIPNFGGPTSGVNSAFANDINGDYFGDRLPGLGAGQFGRAVKSLAELNGTLQGFNRTFAGQLTAYGKALVQAGLFSEAQLKSLGAVMPSIPLIPGSNPNPWNNMFTTNLRFDRPVKFHTSHRENMELTPFVDFYNIFNHAPAGTYGGLGATYGTLNFDYSKNPGQMASDLNVTRGRINDTRRVMLGVRFDF
jgi:hypothetical protein